MIQPHLELYTKSTVHFNTYVYLMPYMNIYLQESAPTLNHNLAVHAKHLTH